eukprot:m.262812 g.262812  ORF g.262812 m.262812 type:complete len:2053 (+) comp17609_c0_seq1:93-6251(+)
MATSDPTAINPEEVATYLGPLLDAPSNELPANLLAIRSCVLDLLEAQQQERARETLVQHQTADHDDNCDGGQPSAQSSGGRASEVVSNPWSAVAAASDSFDSEDERPQDKPSTAPSSLEQPKLPYQITGRFLFSHYATSITRVLVVLGSIETQAIDVIVNPANPGLILGGGVAGAIRKADASNRVQAACIAHVKAHGPVPVGKLALTTAGDLPCRAVLHAVGPSVGGSKASSKDRRDLAACVHACLARAEEEKFSTVALPFISSGLFGFPLQDAINIYIAATGDFLAQRGDTGSLLNIVWINPAPKEANQLAQAWREHCDAVADPDSAPVSRQQSHATPTATATATPAVERTASFSSTARIESKQVASRTTSTPSRTTSSTVTASKDSKPEPKPPRVLTSAQLSSFSGNLWKSAGVLPIMMDADGTLRILLAHEYRSDSHGSRLNFLGGKRDPGERTPQSTAGREFQEETGKQVSADSRTLAAALDPDHADTKLFWLPAGKYFLFVHLVQGKSWATLPERYADKGYYRRGAEAQSLGWLRLQTVLNAVRNLTDVDSRRVSWNVGRRTWTSSPSKFLATILGSKDVQRRLMQWLSPISVNHQAEAVKRLLDLPERDFEAHFLRPEWRLKLASPVLPPPSAVKILRQDDKEYEKIIKELPATQQASLISLRQVDVMARQAIFAKTLGKRKVQKPLYHGTPERWRASSIAVHGFDLKIRLNGRALGDGVYTASDISIPLGYSRGTGSILRLQAVAEEAQPNNNVFVFPKADAVIATHIFDFASEDAQDRKMTEKLMDDKAWKEQLAKDQKRLEGMEADYKRACLVHHRKACLYFHQRVADVQRQGTEPSDGDLKGEGSEESTTTDLQHARLEREAHQFNAHLPIYSYKEEIVKALKQYTVMTFESGTGSGKSTQLPQYLLDEVLDPKDRRRVGVLQPRRINVTQLCERVAKERASEPGDEVGYRMGRGAVLTSDSTRLEFMTHGLFVTMAARPEQVLKQYAGIVLDEAHERSVEIDLSFAYLRNILAMWRSDPGKYGDFKVVVASATIQEQAESFRSFLDPDNTSSTCYVMNQKPLSFPVLVQYRDDMHVGDDTGSRGAGAVITSHALQTAVDILSATPAGDVLVFLPGESEVTACMRGLETLLEWGEGSVKGAKVTKRLLFGDRTAPLEFTLPKDGKEQDPSLFQRFRRAVGREESVRMAALPLYGKSVKAFEQHVSTLSRHRLVIFATNVAETGVTLRNVRYVVDSGLERSVTWNPRTELMEMVTQRCSQSSMQQRTGRAGRTMSGVCVRLFSEEIFSAAPANKAPEIGSGMVTSSLLRLKSMPEQLPLLESLPTDQEDAAVTILQTLGAVDDAGEVTAHGRAYLDLGLNLRLARFLHACLVHGCGRRGAQLAAIMTLDAPAQLLPVTRTDKDTPLSETTQAFLDEFAHPSGDHLTLLQLVEAYRQADRQVTFCTKYGASVLQMKEMEEMSHYVLSQLSTLKDFTDKPQDDKSDEAILAALCAAYGDQVATEATSGRPNDGYLRLLTDEQNVAYRDRLEEFSKSYMPSADQATEADAAAQAVDPSAVAQTPAQPAVPAAVATAQASDSNMCKMRLGHRSTMWHLAASQSQQHSSDSDGEASRFILFTDIILTDNTSSNPCPHLELVSIVTPEQVKENAIGWCDKVNFDKLITTSARRTQRIPLSDEATSIVLRSKGDFLRRVRSRFARCTVGIERAERAGDPNHLRISAPETFLPDIVAFAKRKIKEIEPETVTIPLSEDVKVGKLIGKAGANRERMLGELRDLATGMSTEIDPHDVFLKIDTKRRVVELQLRARAKYIAEVLLGRLHNAINEASDTPVEFAGSKDAQHRLQRLIMKNPPVQPQAGLQRDELMLAMAHFIIWEMKAAVYGGFVRDWVVDGQAANDIDVKIAPGANLASLCQTLQQEGQKYGLSCSGPRQKGAASTLTLQGGGCSFEIDLVDPQKVPYCHPGVDADVNNLVVQLDAQGQAELNYKVNKPALRQASPIPTTMEHIKNKEYVFYYDRQQHAAMTSRRITKMTGKGYTMIKYLPQSQ